MGKRTVSEVPMANVKHRPYRVIEGTVTQMDKEPFEQGEIVFGAETKQQSYGGAILINRAGSDAKYLLYRDDLQDMSSESA